MTLHRIWCTSTESEQHPRGQRPIRFSRPSSPKVEYLPRPPLLRLLQAEECSGSTLQLERRAKVCTREVVGKELREGEPQT
jgi:hypothetical protein